MSDFPTASIPSSWIWSRIQDVATTATGGTPSRSISEYFGGSIPWVKSGELGDGHVFETEETLSELGLKFSNAKLFPKGTLCIALYGATVGKLGILEVDAATNQAVCGVFLPDEVHRDFAFYYLASIRRHLIEQGKGGAQSNISNGLVRQTRIPIAPLNEQARIVAKIEELFSDLDAGVAALKRAKANLKRYRASVLKSAVEGKLTEQWRAKHPAKEPASALLARILLERRQKWEADQLAKFAAAKKEPPKNWRDKYVEPTTPDTTDLSELPEGWCWATTGFLCDCIVPNRDKPKSFSGDIPWVTLPDLDGRIQVVASSDGIGLTEAEATRYKAKVIPAGSVIMSCIGRFGLSVVLGRDAVINQQLHAFLVPALLSARYIAYSIRTQERLMIRLSTATTIAYLNQHKCNAIPIPLAPLAEQEQIVNEVEFRLSQIDAAEKQIEHGLLRAARLRQSILKRAFEGKLVPQDPKDEPASALLERLRASRAIHERSGNRPSSAIPHRSKSRGKKS
jgi:type I restriction enzyme S subunit